MQLLTEITYLMRKDIKLEWRQKYAFYGILLYVILVVFIAYLSFASVAAQTWVTLFWIIMLFTAVNTITKSFVQEGRSLQLYYYGIASPQSIVLSKMIYNTLLMLLISAITLVCYRYVLGFPLIHPWIFLLAVGLGSIGFSLTFTLMAAIASKVGNNMALMAILSLPVFIPMMLMLLALARMSLTVQIDNIEIYKNVLALVAFNAIDLGLAMILFPYLWRD